MTTHTHRFWNMGNKFECACGKTVKDARTAAQKAADRDEATVAFKVRYNKSLEVTGR